MMERAISSGVMAPMSRPAGARRRASFAASKPSSFSRAFSRSEEHTSELQSLMRISYAVFCLKKKKHKLSIKDQKLKDNTIHIENKTYTQTSETHKKVN